MSAEAAGLPRATGTIARLWYKLKRATHVMTTPWAVLGRTAPPQILWQVGAASTASPEIRYHLLVCSQNVAHLWRREITNLWLL